MNKITSEQVAQIVKSQQEAKKMEAIRLIASATKKESK